MGFKSIWYLIVTIIIIGLESKKLNSPVLRRPNFLSKSSKSRNSKPVVLKSFSDEFNAKLLHKGARYDREYLSEYKKMISNLLPEQQMMESTQFGSKEFLVQPKEKKTDKSLFSKSKAKLTNCADLSKSDWETLKVLQEEDRSRVTLKRNRQTGERLVEKEMKDPGHYNQEVEFYRHAHHGSLRYFPKIICASQAASKKARYSIVTDFVDGKQSHLMASKATWDQLRFMVGQLFNALVELHKVGFIHCDLTPANVMVTEEFDVKLIDFGMALPIGRVRGYRGSYYTRAPELHSLAPGKIDVGIDWWAFGATVSIWYFYHFNPQLLLENNEDGPKYHFTPMKLRKKKQFHAQEFPPQFPKDLRNFLSLFLSIDPELRTFSTERLQNMIKEHEFFRGFDWCTAEKC